MTRVPPDEAVKAGMSAADVILKLDPNASIKSAD
jgi:hypothetical protein